MYEFNPITSMELLQNLTQSPCPPACDTISDDPERHAQEAQPVTFGDLVRRMIQRFSSKRRAA
jgi:hypothetical protein